MFFVEFEKYVMSSHWISHLAVVAKSGLPFHVVIYEDLVKDPIGETRKIMKFLEKHNNFPQPNLEKRLLCLRQNLQGQNKRKSRKFSSNPFTAKMIHKINSEVIDVKSLLANHPALNVILPPYENTYR